LRPVITNLALEKCQGTLVHVYVGGESGMPKHGEQPPSISEIPLQMNYELEQNYPNPFNPETNISYALPEASRVRIEIYNVLGQKIATLVNAEIPAGYHSVRWNGRNETGERVGAGIYLCRVQTGEFAKTQKMTLLP